MRVIVVCIGDRCACLPKLPLQVGDGFDVLGIVFCSNSNRLRETRLALMRVVCRTIVTYNRVPSRASRAGVGRTRRLEDRCGFIANLSADTYLANCR